MRRQASDCAVHSRGSFALVCFRVLFQLVFGSGAGLFRPAPIAMSYAGDTPPACDPAPAAPPAPRRAPSREGSASCSKPVPPVGAKQFCDCCKFDLPVAGRNVKTAVTRTASRKCHTSTVTVTAGIEAGRRLARTSPNRNWLQWPDGFIQRSRRRLQLQPISQHDDPELALRTTSAAGIWGYKRWDLLYGSDYVPGFARFGARDNGVQLLEPDPRHFF